MTEAKISFLFALCGSNAFHIQHLSNIIFITFTGICSCNHLNSVALKMAEIPLSLVILSVVGLTNLCWCLSWYPESSLIAQQWRLVFWGCCSETPKAFAFFSNSEPETRVYRELTERVQFDAFISFHSGIRQIYIPYAGKNNKSFMKFYMWIENCI